MDWIHWLRIWQVAGYFEHSNKHSGSVECEEFLEAL